MPPLWSAGWLDESTAKVRAQGIAELGDLTASPRAEVATASAKAEAFLKTIKNIEKAIGVIVAVLDLDWAVSTGAGALAIVKAAKAVKDAAASNA